MDAPMFDGFLDELKKVGGKQGIGQLLAQKAVRTGLNPGKLPAIQQASHLAEAGNRGRAAEIAKNVSGFLKSQRAP